MFSSETKKIHFLVFTVQWLLIGIVSAIDTYLISKYASYLKFYERNYFGLLLMELDQGDVSLFILVKFLGTIIALGLLSLIWIIRPMTAFQVSSVICFLQLLLLHYLCFAV